MHAGSSACTAKGADLQSRKAGGLALPAVGRTCFSMRRMANSAHTVLPEPVGAATSVFSDVWYSVLNTCAR